MKPKKSGSVMPMRSESSDNCSDMDKDQQNTNVKKAETTWTIQEFYAKEKSCNLQQACSQYRTTAKTFLGQQSHSELAKMTSKLLDLGFCDSCLRRSSWAVMGMVNVAVDILKGQHTACADNWKLLECSTTVDNLKSINEQFLRTLNNLEEQKKVLEGDAEELRCQVKHLEEEKSSKTENLVQLLKKNKELKEQNKVLDNYEPLKTTVKELREDSNKIKDKYTKLLKDAAVTETELEKTSKALEEEKLKSLQLEIKVDNNIVHTENWQKNCQRVSTTEEHSANIRELEEKLKEL